MTKSRRGRPSTYTAEIGAEICERLANGETLAAICKDEHLPARRTVLKWATEPKDPTGFGAAYLAARRCQAEAEYDRIRDVESRMALPPTVENPDFDPSQKPSTANPKALPNPDYIDPKTGDALVRSIQWRLSRMRPERYGDRSELHLSGSVETPQPVDQAPEWLKAKVAELQCHGPPSARR